MVPADSAAGVLTSQSSRGTLQSQPPICVEFEKRKVVSYPQQPWQPHGQYPYAPGSPSPTGNSGIPGFPQYGPGPTGFRPNFGAMDQTKVSAVAVVISAAVVLLGSLFSLYSVTVTPSGAAVRNNDAPSGTVEIGIGFFDVAPFPAPVVATAIPLLMLLAALTAAPVVLGRGPRVSGMPAVFAGTAAVLAIVLAISNPLPTVDLTGGLAAELSEEVSGQSLGQLIDSVLYVSPGAGLIIAAFFGVIGWAAAVVMLLRRSVPGQYPPGANPPPTNPHTPPQPNVPPRW